ncbi:hypothetical protein [Chitinophaga barathri]|uniref:Uncharacterized protein n=1 Tax=Chitinophaga barathri TaxID=1647451 RepID=A0A3N4MGY3_9BACT|nr:hypothetical protein [Chitinophaga barathri]RPD43131.1 hypothetical protein EG028_02215 [Chitinophaga barathri]
MKYLLIAMLVAISTERPFEKVRDQIYKSQQRALKPIKRDPRRWEYERTMTHDRSISNYALRKGDSALRAHGILEPFKDSLMFLVDFQTHGFYGGLMWCDSTKIFIWDWSNGFSCKVRSVDYLTRYEQRIVRSSMDFSDSLFVQKRALLGQEHGKYTSLTKWYAPALKKPTITRLFFVPPH